MSQFYPECSKSHFEIGIFSLVGFLLFVQMVLASIWAAGTGAAINKYTKMEQSSLGLSLCLHCGTQFSSFHSEQFCCSGCEFVYSLINTEGLSDFYKIKEANPPTCPIPVTTSKSTFDYCDDFEFIKKMSPDGIQMEFYLEGLNCTACLWLLERLPHFCNQAATSEINLATSTIKVTRIENGSFAKIAQTLNQLGYRPHPLREKTESSAFQIKERRKELIRIGISAAATGNIMIFAVSIYGGSTGVLAEQFRWLTAALAFPVLTYCAWPFYKTAWAGIRNFHLNIDIPIVSALIAGIIMSVWGLLHHQDTIYFDSLSMLVFLLLSSRTALKSLQSTQLQATNFEDEVLLSTVQKRNNLGAFVPVSSMSLFKGDLIKISQDTLLPVDGIVSQGTAMLSTSVLTGESEVHSRLQGSAVEAGSFSHNADWILEVSNPPKETRLAQILRDTEIASKLKSNFVKLSDQVSQWFILISLFAAICIAIYFADKNLQEGLSRALALIIVTCPCVFGIAIPLSMNLALKSAAKKGIIVKGPNSIEALWKLKNIFFDKTGTLTTGEIEVQQITVSQKEDLEIIAALEKDNPHPVAKAFNLYLKKLNISAAKLKTISTRLQGGVEGLFNSTLYSLRPLDLIETNDKESQKDFDLKFGLFADNQLIAEAKLSDQLRLNAKPTFERLKKSGINAYILSGDKPKLVNKCGQLLNIPQSNLIAEQSPEKKAQIIKNFGEGTLMVGDGANDASALAAADVGIAIVGSLDVSLRAADVYLTRPDLNLIVELINISQLTKSAILRNLFFSASFNVVSGSLAALGLMSPLWAAVLMPLSSLTVFTSAIMTGRKL